MNRKKREQLNRQKEKAKMLPKIGDLLRIDGVIHECVGQHGLGGGMWVPYEILHRGEQSQAQS